MPQTTSIPEISTLDFPMPESFRESDPASSEAYRAVIGRSMGETALKQAGVRQEDLALAS